MKKRILLASIMVLMILAVAYPQNEKKKFKGSLDGFEEVPAISTSGSGDFLISINNNETEIAYELSYSDLEGDVTQAHIHLGQAGVNGGVMAFLCSNIGGPPGTQPCPPSPATVSGTLTASDVIGPAAQGIAAGEIAEMIKAIRTGATYVNVHSTLFPGGEIRGQIRPNKKNDD